MKFCCKKKARKEEPVPVVEEPAPVKVDRYWTVHCPKCGAALSLREGPLAHMCPVCNTILQLKTSARIIKDVEPETAEDAEVEVVDLKK